MNKLQPLDFSFEQCKTEILDLQRLLARKKTLKERDQILPFFKKRLHLSAYVGSYVPEIVTYDRVQHEFDLNGSFKCDLVVGDSARRKYAFIEFEDAAPNSIFEQKKRTPEWSRRFEHGFSQLVDWFFLLDDVRHTTDFENAFEGRDIQYTGLLILGRNDDLEARETRRLNWRKEFVQIHAKAIHCITFDQLCEDLLAKVDFIDRISGK